MNTLHALKRSPPSAPALRLANKIMAGRQTILVDGRQVSTVGLARTIDRLVSLEVERRIKAA